MSLSASASRWIRKILKIALVVEIVYVVLVNALLQLPLTQTVINNIRPEKFQVTWDNAWTFYPFRVQVRGGSANGDSRTQTWQADVKSAAGSINLLPLVLKRVWVSNVQASDIDFRMRPRLKPDKDYSQVEMYFPEIAGRESSNAITTPRKKKRPWLISIEDIHVSGNNSYWIYQVRGTTGGIIRSDLDYSSPGGPLELDVFELELELGQHLVNGNQEMFPGGTVKGSLGFAPFMPRENKGLSLLEFLILDVNIDIDVNSLKFINLFMLNFDKLTVDGAGAVHGRVNYDRGVVLEGTDLDIAATDLQVNVLGHDIEGSGQVSLSMGSETGGQLDLAFQYDDLEVIQEGGEQAMLTGESLVLRVGGDGRLLPDPEQVNQSRIISLDIAELTVPDLALFQRYLPQKWPFTLYGGDGTLAGSAELTPVSYSIDLALMSEQADMGINRYRFETNLDAALKLTNPSILDRSSTIDGSYVRLSGASLLKEGQKEDRTWSAGLRFNRGEFNLLGQELKRGNEDVVDLFKILGNSEAKQLLASSGGTADFSADVSSLAWIGVFLGDSHHTQIGGSATIEGVLNMAAGLPEPGTEVAISSHELAVNFLDYTSTGDGNISLEVQEGGDNPDWLLNLDLANADLRRRADSQSYIHDVAIKLQALVENVTFEKEKPEYALHFSMPSARVTDMSVFNSHLPPDSPLKFTGGEANLGAEILLQPFDAEGWVNLESRGVQARLGEQALSADIMAEILLVGGEPDKMAFDISGSGIVLDNVRIEGAEQDFSNEAWSAVLNLVRGDTVFVAPPRLSFEAELEASDSRPIVAMFKNQDGWRPDFLAKALTVEDIVGTAELEMADHRITIPEAYVVSDNIEAGMKAVFEETGNNGLIYLKFKKVDALLKIRDGKKNIDIIKAREKYDDYEVKP